MPALSSSPIDPAIGYLADLVGDVEDPPGLLAVLAKVTDPRRRRGIRHRLAVILGLAVCAALAGARSFTAIGNQDLLAAHAAAAAVQRCQAVSRRTGVDPESIWQWSYIERVSSGLFLLRLGHEAEARPFLEAADRLGDSVTPWPKTTG